MTDIKRYLVSGSDFKFIQHSSGYYVEFKDHAAIVSALQEQVRALSLVLESVQQERDEYRDLYSSSQEKLEAAERERDELKENQTIALQLIARMERQVLGYQEEIARRDAAAGEPVAWQYRYNDGKVGDWKTVDSESECNHSPCYERRSIYTAAPPAVLPDIDRYTHGLFPHAVEQLTSFRDDALALGAQQQKVVELPEPVKWPEIPFKYFSEEQVFSMLDAAGVKWEVKK